MTETPDGSEIPTSANLTVNDLDYYKNHRNNFHDEVFLMMMNSKYGENYREIFEKIDEIKKRVFDEGGISGSITEATRVISPDKKYIKLREKVGDFHIKILQFTTNFLKKYRSLEDFCFMLRYSGYDVYIQTNSKGADICIVFSLKKNFKGYNDWNDH